jgi:hypothetical protein
MDKVFKLFKVENGSAQLLSVAQNAKYCNFKLINAGKLRDFGKCA